jgi:thioredoxin reductase
MDLTERKKVCIIGAGPRGLVTARHLSAVSNLDITIFEAKEDIGGLWFFKPKNSDADVPDSSPVQDNYCRLYGCQNDSMYETLITNLPYFFMEFKDLGMRDVDPDLPLFISIVQYKRYLDAYAEKFDLRKYVKFNNLIKSVRLNKNLSQEERHKISTEKKFVVKTVPAKGDCLHSGETFHDFDYVVVTSGQYSFPYMPDIPGAENFSGQILHYKNFGSPNAEQYRGKKVLVVGGSDGAADLLIQFFSNDIQRIQDCEKVIICSRKVSHLRDSDDFKQYIREGRLSLHQGTLIEYKDQNVVRFSDGTEEEVDTVVYATGYKLKFPYFDQETDKIIDHNENEHRGTFFGPLYKKVISIREPDLFFVGYLETTLIVNILPELQAMAVRYILEGKLEVPSQEDMLKVHNEEVELHMKHIGDLAHFYKTDLSVHFPGLPNNYEHTEWRFFSDWLKNIYPENDEEMAEKYFDIIANTKKALVKFRKEGNFLQFKKYDYHLVYPKEFRSTTAFV